LFGIVQGGRSEELRKKSAKIISEINNLISNSMIEFTFSDYNKFIKVLKLTTRGKNEINLPTLFKKKLSGLNFEVSNVNDKDREKFLEFGDFLKKYNDEQKKVIVSASEKILCIAGAGSGKTSVLVKRIEFLVKKSNILPQKILAITFTRKAKKEMDNRLDELGIFGVHVYTFNSFCEKILKEYENKIYGRAVRVQSYSDKIFAMNMALANLGLTINEVIDGYFSKKQREFKNGNQLIGSFMNDCFSVIEYFKITGEKEYDFSKDVDGENKKNAEIVYSVNKYLNEHIAIQGLRDFTDQILDTLNFFEKNNDYIPNYEHVLIDEYQDVNSMQVKLLKLLKPKNLFAVGDPRQAIFGWRGADIKYILNFEKDFGNSEIVYLTKNYRSSKNIVEFMNSSVKDFGLPNLENHKNEETEIRILDFDSEEAEKIFVINNILESEIPLDEIFILARTNRQLIELSNLMKTRGVPHIVRTDDQKNQEEISNGVTLATIHAIKGLQAKKVIVIGCNEQNFPCKASDHPAIEMIKLNNYNREEEEKRLFYVAISRAKEILYLTYSGKKPTYFINDEMIRISRR
jgi:superfamily I DNA/RNA helicase